MLERKRRSTQGSATASVSISQDGFIVALADSVVQAHEPKAHHPGAGSSSKREGSTCRHSHGESRCIAIWPKVPQHVIDQHPR